MLTRRQFLVGAGVTAIAAALPGDAVFARRLLLHGLGAESLPAPEPPSWTVDGADEILADLAAAFTANEVTVDDGVDTITGYRPAPIYDAVWTRDMAYIIWHHPTLLTATERREWIEYALAKRSTTADADPDGGNLPADFIADRIEDDGTRVFKNAGASELPFMDGIHFVVLALWADWNLTGETTTFDNNQEAIDDCLAAIPRSANGCVFSDPSAPSVDYGFTDTVKKTGDVAFGTALQAWAYKMLDEISEGGSSTAESETYANLRAEAEAGLATLRKPSGWYAGSSGNNADRDDVWATALAVAERLVHGADRIASAQAIADAYADGTTGAFGYTSTITQFGLVRHMPVGQTWAGTSTPSGTYQNGGYWLTPLWDCVRAVDLVDPDLARTWAAEAMQQVADEITVEGDPSDAPYEWHNHTVGVGAKGYTPSAAAVNRFV